MVFSPGEQGQEIRPDQIFGFIIKGSWVADKMLLSSLYNVAISRILRALPK